MWVRPIYIYHIKIKTEKNLNIRIHKYTFPLAAKMKTFIASNL